MNAALMSGFEPAVRGVVRRDEPMARHSSWRCGGPATLFFAPADREDLSAFLAQGDAADPLLWLGLGSNLLVRDGGIAGMVVSTTPGLAGLSWLADDLLYAECGVTCAKLARECVARGRTGLEFLAGIPGSLGGALAMNAGAVGGEIWQFVDSVETVDRRGQVQRHEAGDFAPAYRSVQGPAMSFVGASLRLPMAPDAGGAGGAERIKAVLAQRSATQPTGKATCGSVFRNPADDYAGRLIEQCGLKGHRIGGAAVSQVHANFIENDQQATAADIEALIQHVQDTVLRATGIALECEVRIVGEPAAETSGGDA